MEDREREDREMNKKGWVRVKTPLELLTKLRNNLNRQIATLKKVSLEENDETWENMEVYCKYCKKPLDEIEEKKYGYCRYCDK